MDSSLLAMAAGLGASVQQGQQRSLGPPSVCSHWVMADGDLNTFLLNNPSNAVTVALDAQPYNVTWQQAFVPSEGNRWWGRKRVGQHSWQYYNCETTLPQNSGVYRRGQQPPYSMPTVEQKHYNMPVVDPSTPCPLGSHAEYNSDGNRVCVPDPPPTAYASNAPTSMQQGRTVSRRYRFP